MKPLRATALIDAPESAVRRVLGRTDIWTRTVRALGARAEVRGARTGPRAQLRSGDLIKISSDRHRWSRPPGSLGERLYPRRSLILRVDIQPDLLPSLQVVAGPARFCRISLAVAQTEPGTLVTVECQLRSPSGGLTPLYRRRISAAEQLLLGIARLAAAEVQVVVAGAIIEGGKVLAGRRTQPAELAGKWELPGGKVNPGETEEIALTRELAEELGVAVVVGDRIGPDIELGGNVVLRCRRARITAGRPSGNEHDVIRWIGADALTTVDWLPADHELLAGLRRFLR